MPWAHPPGVGPGEFVPVELAQTGPLDFTLREDLVWVAGTDDPGAGDEEPGSRYVVPAGFTTDLASVPYPLWALIGPFGRHTRAAILHDHGVRTLPAPRRSPSTFRARERIDLRFRAALLASGVPRLRAYLMWAGTTLDRVARHGPPLLVALLLLELAGGLACFVLALRTGGWTGVLLFVLPAVPALAWGRARLAIVLAQYVGALVVPVLLLNLAVGALLGGVSGLVGGRREGGISPARLPGPIRPRRPGAPRAGSGERDR